MTRFAHGTPIYRTEEIRRIEAIAAAQSDAPQLMQRAGLAAAELARELAISGKRVLVIAGPGNNGGDALVLARHLKSWWFKVDVMFTGDAARLSPDAAAAYTDWQAADGPFLTALPAAHACGLIVDGLFGIGLERELTGRYAELVAWMNNSSGPILALDVPSGLESDSGRVLGGAVRASDTITFIALKPGLLTLNGPDQCGTLHLATLGLDAPALMPACGRVIGREVLSTGLRRRRINTHKGDYGSVAIIGGASGMLGAALLAGRAALKVGAGRVYVGCMAENAPAVDSVQPELMLRTADQILALDHLACLAVGPGLGQTDKACALLTAALGSPLPLVLDADALNLLAQHSALRTPLLFRTAPTLLTPHPAEAARLLGTTTPAVQAERVAAALKLAEMHRCGVVLKGAGSILAWPDGRWAVNSSGNPGMASAGMGDVLTGILAALLAQGADALTALECGVYLHGAAADALAQSGVGPVGLTASDVIDAARRLLNAMEREDDEVTR
ncbi:MAG TPA: NAD(P)H-hydrate dehydratase [Burkholderiales bacterium]